MSDVIERAAEVIRSAGIDWASDGDLSHPGSHYRSKAMHQAQALADADLLISELVIREAQAEVTDLVETYLRARAAALRVDHE